MLGIAKDVTDKSRINFQSKKNRTIMKALSKIIDTSNSLDEDLNTLKYDLVALV